MDAVTVTMIPARDYVGRILDAMYRGDRRTMTFFFECFLRLPAEPEFLEAFFEILNRSETWRVPGDTEGLQRYLRTSVWRRAQEVLVSWGEPSRMRSLAARQEALNSRRRRAEASYYRERPTWRAEDSLNRIAAKERVGAIVAGMRLSGPQNEMLRLVRDGLEPMIAGAHMGLDEKRTKVVWQSLVRKLRRRVPQQSSRSASTKQQSVA